jgi:hypothetical protein
VDALILGTTTPDRHCPATAPEAAACLGLETIAAFDIAAVCSGFVYSLSNGVGLIAACIDGSDESDRYFCNAWTGGLPNGRGDYG